MRVCLLRPNYHTHLVQPALALGYLAAVLRRERIEVRCVDGVLLGLSDEEIAAATKDFDCIAISCLSSYHRSTLRLLPIFKARKQTVVLGGPHITALREQALDENADYLVIGEGELSLLDLLRDLEGRGRGENIPGVISRGGSYTPRPFISDLDSVPFPDWSDTPPEIYPKAPHGGVAKHFPIAPIVTTRGCPYTCTFCSSPSLWHGHLRYRSPENVVDEIGFMIQKFGVKEVHFEDDNLTLSKKHVLGVCEEILRRKIDISWATPNGIRADRVDYEVLSMMKKSGCYSVAFGVESANREILERCQKKEDLGKIDEAVNLASELGLITQGFFIFGLPGETEQTIEETISWAEKSRLDKAQFLLLDLLPGSGLWNTISDRREAGSYESFHDVSWCPPGLDPEVLASAPSRAFRRFFLRSPRRIWKMLTMLRPEQFGYVVRRVRDFRIIHPRTV